MVLLKVLSRFGQPHWPLFVGVVVLQAIVALATLYIPTLNADIINNGVAKADTAYIWRTGAWMLAVALVQIVAAIVGAYLGSRGAMAVGRDMRRALFHQVSGFSAREVSHFGPGSLITRNTNDVQQVQMLVQVSVTMLVLAPLLAIGGVIMAVRHDVGLAWVLAVAIPVLLVITGLIIGRMIPGFRLYQDKLDGLNRVLREQLAGIRVVRAFVREEVEKKRFAQANDDMLDIGWRVGSLFVFLFPAVMFVLEITIVAIIWFGGAQVDNGTTQVGTLFAFMAYAMQILMGVVMGSFLTIFISRAVVAARRIHEVLATDTSLHYPDSPVTQLPTPGRLEFRQVSFGYPGAESPVLQDVSFTVEPGQTLAIVGSTGAGKTTLTNLIPRLVDVTAGQVLVGGVDVRQLAQETLAGRVALVPQRPYLFGGTIASNLQFGRPQASEEDMWAALECAQAKDFVAAKEGQLAAPISQGGTNVSGGQRQRLAIARALVAQPDILVFDDSFSALDVATDARLRAALWSTLPDVTKIVVAQRVSTIQEAERILVLDEGRVVGLGSHAELLASCAVYQEIIDSQLGAEAA
ncbi:ABC transporter ATP-binding protein [Buchananella hordeovulneris]|uniref:ABC transporter ATP-binding protein n=1 Tax=Buchananella hordeovulneris TaxID=52770 RepID=UPI000F5F05EF|nr:ABC transporter ATP-binding protein [Buchananella hordeovulneris]RRD43292.1 ABC transporter ATP-binding protein [Buchananella hordeovulneris]